MLAISSWIVLLIYMALCIFADECSIEITAVHSNIIKNLSDAQAITCEIPVKILNKEDVTDDCDLWALVYEVNGLLDTLRFIKDTDNYKRKELLKETYIDCILSLDEMNLDDLSSHLETRNMNVFQILERVNHSLHKLDGFKGPDVEHCAPRTPQEQDSTVIPTGPHCTCPSPTTSISSSEASQTLLSHLSEFTSRTYTTSYFFHTSPLAEGTSGSYAEKLLSPQKTSQGLDSSPSTSTDMPSDLNSQTTIMDHSYTGATVQSAVYTDFPLTNSDFPVHSTKSTKGTYEPYVTTNPSQTRTDPEQVKKKILRSYTESMYESGVPPTIENTSLPTYSLYNGEFSTVKERDEKLETTMSEFDSKSPKGSLSVPSKEPGIDTSSMSVTKMRRSLVNMDETSSPAMTRQAVSSLSTSATDPNFPFKISVHTNIPSSGIGLSNTEAPNPVSQGEVTEDKNLGWASSYLSSTMLTTKTKLPLSSPMPGGKLLPSDINPVLNAHNPDNIIPQQERGIAIGDRQNNFPGPSHGSNMLPIIATENSDGKQNEQVEREHNESKPQMIIILILGAVVLLLLCGLLYYRHQNQVLKRNKFNTSCDIDLTRNPGAVLPEEREHLQGVQCDIV